MMTDYHEYLKKIMGKKHFILLIHMSCMTISEIHLFPEQKEHINRNIFLSEFFHESKKKTLFDASCSFETP